MATLRPFRGYRPKPGLAADIASPPYDVLSSDEARAMAGGNPRSFLHVGKSEIDLPEGTDVHSEAVYRKAHDNLRALIDSGDLVQDGRECLYLYRQVMRDSASGRDREQTGVLALASVDEYVAGRIKKHELTRVDKENDRARHIEVSGSHSGPAFFTYRAVAEIDAFVKKACQAAPDADFTAKDGIRHSLWVVSEPRDVAALSGLFAAKVESFYIADGHHRSAAAARVRDIMKSRNANHTGSEGYNFFLAVAFPDQALRIMDYNRTVKDLNGLSTDEFLSRLSEAFERRPLGPREDPMPEGPKQWGMFLDGAWYRLTAKAGSYPADDPIESLDVQILQKNLLKPVLGVDDPRTDKRIDFVGGIRGFKELEKRCATDMRVAFQCYPTTVSELIRIADAGKIMPPKSTWFEPKLRDGMVIDLM
jgi:uncharacterized protein (DUF1015 family)